MSRPRRASVPAWALAAALLAAGTGACSAPSAAPPPSAAAQGPGAFLAPGVRVTLPPPAALGHAWRASQLLTADYGGRRGQIPVELEVGEGRVTLVGLAAVGPPLFTIRYDGRTIEAQIHGMEERLPPPEQILADVMLVYWPREAWLPRFPPGWRLEDEGPWRRLVDAAGTAMVQIHTAGAVEQPHTVELSNTAFNYRIQIVTYASESR